MATVRTEKNNGCGAVKISGYLEKKGKNRVVSTWKKYWFVLEGRLLLYYKSQSEVKKLCPCRGSINIGLASDVRPLITQQQQGGSYFNGIYMFEIVTHINNTVLLRTKDKATQEQWLQALLDALGQPKISNPVQSQFRYSIDSLMSLNSGPKTSFRRQNTLPQDTTKCILLQRRETFLDRIKRINGITGSRSFDRIPKVTQYYGSHSNLDELRYRHSKEELSSVTDSDTEDNAKTTDTEENTGYRTDPISEEKDFLVENTVYIPTQDENRNIILDDEQYTILVRESEEPIEYYCTYDEVKKPKPIEEDLYSVTVDANLPDLPPRRLESISTDDTMEYPLEEKREEKKNKIFNFLHKNEKKKSNGNKVKRKSSFFQKIFKNGKKKEPSTPTTPSFEEYEYVDMNECPKDYEEPPSEQSSVIGGSSTNLNKKGLCGAREMLSETTLRELEAKFHRKFEGNTDQEEDSEIYESIDMTKTITPEECPGLPPRRRDLSPRTPSPYHDIPRNNSPCQPSHSPVFDPIIPVIIENDRPAYSQVTKKPSPKVPPKPTKPPEELTVQQLIHKYNDQCAAIMSKKVEIENEIMLRKETRNSIDNRHSEELCQLLNQLSQITSAPLNQPRGIHSLVLPEANVGENGVQHRSVGPLTDEEWLAIAPIRRRRHSEPDYDVPRSHKSLDLNVPPLPPKSSEVTFRPISTRIDSQSTLLRDSIEPPSLTWSWSMTPDSLETNSEISNYQRKYYDDKFLPIKEANNNLPIITDGFFDSLEHATLF